MAVPDPRDWKVGLISAADAKIVDEAYDGLRQGLNDAGLVDGRDFTINYKNAQGDIATLNSIWDEMNGDDTSFRHRVRNDRARGCVTPKIDRKPCSPAEQRSTRSPLARASRTLRPSPQRRRGLSCVPLRGN